ncbi:hypothetical protein ACRALDRAFT_2042984 [Sodiomyces alcalophilus JCM 7366]|uniref:uncharacterized protein n=1 Tax=Sodiomyces alcalophilus JCM 7366 TaxID=591952 RepID=UPI0039B42DB1
MGQNWRYGVVFDAGSSGTRMYIYKWEDPAKVTQHATLEELRRLPAIKLESSEKIRPGVSSFASVPETIGSDHLRFLVELALVKVPHDKVPDTPVYIMATAGMRLLPAGRRQGLLLAMCSYLRDSTSFSLPDCSTNVQVISGETEGLYGWLAVNYLLGLFDYQDDLDNHNGHHTYGFLDMGGASAQIAFVPNATEAEKHAEDLKLIRLRNIDGTISEYKVFTASWLGYGANQARKRYIDKLLDAYDRPVGFDVLDPCMPSGLRTTLNNESLPRTVPNTEFTLVGTGNFSGCLAKTEPLLRKDAPCIDEPCLLNGEHVPLIDFSINRFVGVSEYWHTTHGVFGGKHEAYKPVTYQQRVLDFCSRSWDEVIADLMDRKVKGKVEDAQEACFKASWLINILYEGIGFPRFGVEHDLSFDSNISEINIETGKERSFVAPFQPLNRIGGVEVSWTLGRVILYASGQIPPQRQYISFPVGFGSNVPGAADFELAGSAYDITLSVHKGHGALDSIMDKARANSGSTIIPLILLGAIITILFHERARRLHRIRWLNSIIRLNRFVTSPLRFRLDYSLTNRLFERRTYDYERVMEEGDVDQMDLGNIDSDECSALDMSDSMQARRLSPLTAPRSTLDPLAARLGDNF